VIGTVAILGAGNAGMTAAAHLALRGYRVRLASRSDERLRPVRERGGIELVGVAGEGAARLEQVTTDLAEAIEGADLIMLTVAGPGLEAYGRALAPVLPAGARIFLNPGQCGGALHLRQVLRSCGAAAPRVIGESHTLTYGCRVVGPARAWAYVLVRRVFLAALPACETPSLVDALLPLYPSLVPAPHVLFTSLHYLNGILHPPGMVCNAGWIEHARGGFRYYLDGTTPAVARVIERVDQERLTILDRLGVCGVPFIDAFYEAGYTTPDARASRSVYRAFQESEPNKPRPAPESLRHRYMEEDVPYGLVPMAALARLAGVPTPTIDALVTLASVLMGSDYWHEGRTAERMGLAGRSLSEVLADVCNGGP
jgi:opine dehydrogenase